MVPIVPLVPMDHWNCPVPSQTTRENNLSPLNEMHIHQQNHWNDILFYWYQSYHWAIGLTNRIRLCILDMCHVEFSLCSFNTSPLYYLRAWHRLTKPLSRIQSLSEPRGGSKMAKPIFSNSAKRYRSFSLSRNKKINWQWKKPRK